MTEQSEPPSSAPPPGVLGVVALPGLALWKRWPVAGSLLFAAGVIAPAFALVLLVQHRDDIVGLLTRPHILRGLALVAIAAITSRAIAVVLTADRLATPDARHQLRVRGGAAVALLALPTALGVLRLEQAADVVSTVFQDSADAGGVEVHDATLDPFAGEFHTVLLLGSDEGDDRVGVRTDSMMLAFIHEETGRAALVSVPRNLVGAQFPPGSVLAEQYPDGYDDDEGGLLNALYNTVVSDDELTEAYEQPATPAGIHALMEAISYSFGITIDDYVMINSCGFVKVVDAIGGVVIDVPTELPMPSQMRCSNYVLTPTIGPGEIFMDGTKALGYVRSRLADSDYQRMERQRILLQTIVDEVGFTDLLAHFGELADALEDNVHTSMTVDEARQLLAVLQNQEQVPASIGLAPPLFEPSEPNFDQLRSVMQALRRALVDGTSLETFGDVTLDTTVD